MQVLFDNRWQARKIRWLTISFAFWCVGWLYWAWTAFETYGLAPADGGALRGLSERLGVAALIALGGLLPLGGLMFYSTLYLTRIERDGDLLVLTALGAVGPARHRYRVSDFAPPVHYEGKVDARTKVNAPWLTLRAHDRRMPFIVDLQAEHVDVAALTGLSARGR